MKKYSWFENHEEEFPFTVIHTENEIETNIALTDSAEKADFITKACNQFSLEKFEEENQSNPYFLSGEELERTETLRKSGQ